MRNSFLQQFIDQGSDVEISTASETLVASLPFKGAGTVTAGGWKVQDGGDIPLLTQFNHVGNAGVTEKSIGVAEIIR